MYSLCGLIQTTQPQEFPLMPEIHTPCPWFTPFLVPSVGITELSSTLGHTPD